MANRQRSSVRRWAQLALGAAIVMHGIAGFPTPQDPDPPEAAADSQTHRFCYNVGEWNESCYNRHPRPHTHPPPPPANVPPVRPVCTSQNFEYCEPQQAIYDEYHGSDPPCDSQTHGGSCNTLGDMGVTPDLLDGEPSAKVPFGEAQQIALEACAANSPPCNQQAAAEAWAAVDKSPDGGVDRITQAQTMCAAYGGSNGCPADTDEELIDWMCDTGYTTECGSDFRPDEPMTTGQTWSFNERPILEQLNGGPCDNCYVPPGGHQRVTSNIGRPGCDNGLAVIDAHIDSVNDDDGCRPGHCDFGRNDDGWCAPPTNADPPTIYIVGSSADEDAGTMRFRVQMSHAGTTTSTVTANTRDGTAVEGDDYTATTRTVTIPAGQTARYVDVAIVNDADHENEETFMMALSAPSTGTTLSPTPEADATIRDDDPAPLLVSISGSPTEEEGDSLAFSVGLDMVPTSAVSVSFRVDDPYYQGHPLYLEDGPYCGWQPTTDYEEPSNTTLTWAAGETRFQTVSIRTCDDSIDEQDKTLTVELHSASGAAIGVGSASGTITDNDAASVYPTVTDPTFFVNSPTVEEGGELEFVVEFLPVGSNWWGSLTIDFSGSATLSAASTECDAVGDDAHINRRFTSAQDTYTRTRNGGGGWVGGSTLSLVLYTCDDMTPEALETITAALSTTPGRSSTAADVGPDGVGTIIDNDNPEAYLAGPVTVTEGATLSFEVRLRQAAPEDVTVTVSTATDPAATHPADATGAGRDYLPRTGYQVVIPAGSLSATVLVLTSGDTADEYTETMLLRIDDVSSVVGGVVGSPASAVGTIVDDDNPPQVSIFDASGAEGGGPITFVAVLSAVSRKTVTVTASTAASTPLSAAGARFCVAVDGSDDYQTNSMSLLFVAGTVTALFAVTVCDDTALESDEAFAVTLTSASNTIVSSISGDAVGTIVDDDTPVVLPVYVAPPPAPECPTGWHDHGFDCHPDHSVPVVCGTSAHAYQVHDVNDADMHQSLTHPACVAASDVCSTGFHDHAGTCVRTHEDPPLPCYTNRRLVWENTIHSTSEVLACPYPDVDIEMLAHTAGGSITLTFGVDVTSGHVEPTRTFRITAVDGTAVNGTHYTMTTPVTATFSSATHTYTVSIPTIARQDHGPDPRRFTVTIVDTHPLRGHVTVSMTAAINPPAIERQ